LIALRILGTNWQSLWLCVWILFTSFPLSANIMFSYICYHHSYIQYSNLARYWRIYLLICILWFYPTFWSWDMNIYLLVSNMSATLFFYVIAL
jgi:hypothetical protein